MPKLFPAQQAQRRAHILDAAETCFAIKGFHRTTMKDICQQAKVSPGALYLYFVSKEALIDGIVARDREEVLQELERVQNVPDLAMGLEQLMRVCVLERPPHKAALYVEMLAEAVRNPQVAQTINECEASVHVALAGLLRQAQVAGKIVGGINTQDAARLLMMLGDGIFVLKARKPAREVELASERLLEMIGAYLFSPGAAALMAGAAE